MLNRIKNFLEWGVYDLNEIIEDKKIFIWFYSSDNFDIRYWSSKN